MGGGGCLHWALTRDTTLVQLTQTNEPLNLFSLPITATLLLGSPQGRGSACLSLPPPPHSCLLDPQSPPLALHDEPWTKYPQGFLEGQVSQCRSRGGWSSPGMPTELHKRNVSTCMYCRPQRTSNNPLLATGLFPDEQILSGHSKLRPVWTKLYNQPN